MAEIPGWLRGFQRARNPIPMIPSGRLSLVIEGKESVDEVKNAPSTTRTPSYQNPRRLTLHSKTTESQPNQNQVENIWHNPAPDQMAETLKVAMMTQNSFDPLHVSYNSCILHVLEAYHHMREELIEKDREIWVRKLHHENDIKKFRQQQRLWDGKENEYKSELKNLEVMIAIGARGLDQVMLARSRSALDENARARTAEAQSVKNDCCLQDVASDEEPMMSDFAERKDSFLSARYTSRRRMLNGRRKDDAFTTRQPWPPEAPLMIDEPTGGTKDHKKDNDPNSNIALSGQEHQLAGSETDSIFSSMLEQEAGNGTEQYPRKLKVFENGQIFAEQDEEVKDGGRSRPKILTNPEQIPVGNSDDSNDEGDEAKLYHGNRLIDRSAVHHRGFSFIPGDDYGNLALGRARSQTTVLVLDGHGNAQRPLSYLSSSNSIIDLATPKKQRRREPVPVAGGRKIGAWGGKPSTASDFEPTRSDLQTSIVTAVPDQSTRSSKCSEIGKDAPGCPNQSRLSGNNEAIIAAVRAITENRHTAPKAP